jgi:hypothetical protein
LVDFSVTAFTFTGSSERAFEVSLIGDASAWIDVCEEYAREIDNLENLRTTIRDGIDKEI